MQKAHLIVEYRAMHYALPTQVVREIVWLPALTPIDEMPPYIVGAFNLRGAFVPVIDLALRFAEPSAPLTTDNQVVILEHENIRVGLIVSGLSDVVDLDTEDFEAAEAYQLPGGQRHFVSGILKYEGALLMRLDIDALLSAAPISLPPAMDSPADATMQTPDGRTPALAGRPDAPIADEDAPENEIYRQRAEELARQGEAKVHSAVATYALIRLGGELHGLNVAAVGEFTRARGISPIPCTPEVVAGSMNLRGDILTLIDLRPLLGLAPAALACEVIVLQRRGVRLGLVAEEIEDVVDLTPAQISPAPELGWVGGLAWCAGIGQVGESVFSLIDLETVLAALRQRMTAGP